MARPTTIPRAWLPLVQAYGGNANLAREMGVSQGTLRRMSRGESPISTAMANHIDQLAKARRVSNPLRTMSRPKRDVRTLELLGDAIRQGIFPQRAIKHALKLYTVEDLIALAEDDTMSVNVLRAAAYLLEIG